MKPPKARRKKKSLALVKTQPPVEEVEFEVLPGRPKKAVDVNRERGIGIDHAEYEVRRDNNELEYVVIDNRAVALAPIKGPFPAGGRTLNTELCPRQTDPGRMVVLGGLVEEEQWINPRTRRSQAVTDLPDGAYVQNGVVVFNGGSYAIFKRWVEKQGTVSVVPEETRDSVLQVRPVAGKPKRNEKTFLSLDTGGGTRRPHHARILEIGPADADD